MSFSFGFDIDSSEIDAELADLMDKTVLDSNLEEEITEDGIPHAEVDFSTLLATLPPLISFTPVEIPLSNNASTSRTMLRRDLFDARFQVIAQDSDPDRQGMSDLDKGKGKETYVEEDTDLVKGIYEGGLKTWECSLDLVDCLTGLGYNVPAETEQLGQEVVRGKSFLELGCGTALPTCAVFARLLEEIRRSPTDPASPNRPPITKLHLQDYNNPVLSLITLPNILLTFAQHLASFDSAHALLPPIATDLNTISEDAEEDDSAMDQDSDENEIHPGELDITPEFLESFESLLELENIEFKFFEGDWNGMKIQSGQEFDVVLTSETIYSLPSLPSLLKLLRAACRIDSKCLVACKRIYFGVGGGEVEFTKRVEENDGGSVTSIWGGGVGLGRDTGVSRVVMSVQWN